MPFASRLTGEDTIRCHWWCRYLVIPFPSLSHAHKHTQCRCDKYLLFMMKINFEHVYDECWSVFCILTCSECHMMSVGVFSTYVLWVSFEGNLDSSVHCRPSWWPARSRCTWSHNPTRWSAHLVFVPQESDRSPSPHLQYLASNSWSIPHNTQGWEWSNSWSITHNTQSWK